GVLGSTCLARQHDALMVSVLPLGVRWTGALAVGTPLRSLLPSWYMRLGMHIALASHWLIVLAVAVAVDAIRNGVSGWTVVALSALGALAFGIHPYLFVMAAMIAVGALLADVARSGMKYARKDAARLAIFDARSAASAG